MSDFGFLWVAFAVGLAVGLVFFGGLWWTTQKVLLAPHPALWLIPSFLIRSAVVVTGFLLVNPTSWTHLLTCLAGFLAARFLIRFATRPPKAAG